MRRLNVQFSQIEECIRTSMFAVDMLPANPPLEPGEPLLLQLTKADAAQHGELERRIQFTLIFDHAVPDPTGAISREHWPQAGKVWKHILFCSETVPCIPFSLEQLGLAGKYAGQTNPVYIEPQDEAKIRPHLKGATQPAKLLELSSIDELLATIHNYDRVVELEPVQKARVREHERRLSDPWLGDMLKTLYEHRCQICLHDFTPQYGIPFADTRFLKSPGDGGMPVSRNLLVLCPNHDAIIGAARPEYRPRSMSFLYPNGLVERITLRDHLLS